ncbi:hypothetical protein ACFHWD_04165 [Clostridium sp. MT-14]|uniref:hypothetical protein n=1 Tax=Clostridium sp. MT-14 TaxID=3348360 RepID=UPI0035F49456
MADNFYYNTGTILSKNILKTLASEITQNAGDYKWTLEFPTTIDSVVDQVMLSTVITDNTDTANPISYNRYLKINRPTPQSLDTNEEELIDKYNHQGAFTDTEISYLQKYFGGQNFSTTPVDEVTFLKNWYNNVKDHAGTLTEADITFTNAQDQAIMNSIKYVKNFVNVNELFLYAKELSGEELTTEEQNTLTGYKTVRTVTPEDTTKFNNEKKVRGLTDDLAKLVILDFKNAASSLTSSIGAKDSSGNAVTDVTLLANYRASRVISQEEMNEITAILLKINVNNALMWQIGDEIEDTKIDFVEKHCSIPARMGWYRTVHTNLTDYTGCDYWLTINKTSLNLVVRGDPSVDVSPYENYLVSYAYVGKLDPINEDSDKDYQTNWGMTVSSDVSPSFTTDTTIMNVTAENETYGYRTGTGVTDVVMMATSAGIPYQAHDIEFKTINPTMDKQNIEGSRWNKKKREFDVITVTHTFDMQRGNLQNVLIGDGSTIYDGDRLVYVKTGEDPEMYIKFKITAPYNFINNSPNVDYVLALRVKYEEIDTGTENPGA